MGSSSEVLNVRKCVSAGLAALAALAVWQLHVSPASSWEPSVVKRRPDLASLVALNANLCVNVRQKRQNVGI